MSKVALIRCESYEYEEVKAVVEKGISLLGGASGFVKAGEKILLKPNWLSADPPEKCVTTHPIVFKAVAEIFKEQGVILSYGDSPAFQSPESAGKKTGISEIAEDFDIFFADFRKGKEIYFDKGVQNKKFTIANGVIDSDGVISLPKMKTHGFQRVTGAVKNQFGCVPGTLKAEFHVKVPDAYDFAKMLVDLNSAINPRLYVMDGIYAMEGNGPKGGTPKKMNAILLSKDPIALDATMCRLMNLDPKLLPTNKAGMEMGAGTYLEKEIELIGDNIDDFIDKSFDVNRNIDRSIKINGGMKFAKNIITPKPYIDSNKCIKCGICVNMCPVNPKAVGWYDGNKENPPTYIYDRCIRCYCCQELCPESAISIKQSIFRRIMDKRNS
ncbi:MAG TPA: DUF362 domain-containing protein [Anaerovoracaceae bacterium]|nr:DUF362 domain-containing protein [Anaerovoracaceae bacterium]